MAGIGHNSKADFGPGYAGRVFAWQKARAALIPRHMPIEIVRKRVKRAAELGLDYKTYASFRAASGHDVVALLFSSNALRMLHTARMPADRAARLADVAADRIVLAHAPLDVAAVAALSVVDRAGVAPRFTDSWSVMASTLRAPLRAPLCKPPLPADGVVIIGDTDFEATWCAAARAMGYVPAARYFP